MDKIIKKYLICSWVVFKTKLSMQTNFFKVIMQINMKMEMNLWKMNKTELSKYSLVTKKE